MNNKRVAVALSGGIDSAGAVYLLQKEEWTVEGFMLVFPSAAANEYDTAKVEQARRIAEIFSIPLHIIDVSGIFKKEIVEYFVRSYLRGVTPNPCVFCNSIIKFGALFDKVRSCGIQFFATGHYARIVRRGERYLIARAKDRKKSQEYFLSLIPPAVLPNILFPVGDYTKEEVRGFLQQKKQWFSHLNESQDICFVQSQHYTNIIEASPIAFGEYSGEIKHISGQTIGRHKGIYYFTYGQRGGLGIAWKEPLYVVDIDYETRTVVVGEQQYLYRDTFRVEKMNWFLPPKDITDVQVKIRYNSKPYACDIAISKEYITVRLKDKVSSVTPGQIAVLYDGDAVAGGGIIAKNR